MHVPLMDPKAQYEPYIDELSTIAADVIQSGRFILGPLVSAFESAAADYLGVKHCIGVANGTDALTISLRALGIGPGDEVICPAYTFYATCETIASVGAKPVFADVEPVSATLDPKSVAECITNATKAIMPVHLFGHCANVEQLREIAEPRDIAIIEDAAQAWGAKRHGKRAGSLGDVATFSFFPTKNLPCFGDGGLIATDRDDVAEMTRMLRFHGSKDKKVFEHVGYNSRLDEIQAGILSRNLLEVDAWNAHRRTVAGWYEEAGLGDFVDLPQTDDDNEPIWHLYVVRSERRDQILTACKDHEVGAAVYYGDPMHLQPVFTDLGYSRGDLPVTERLCDTGLALPMFATMTREQVDAVVAAVKVGVGAGEAAHT